MTLAILEKEVMVSLGAGQKHYEKLGYYIPRRKDSKGRLRIKRGTKIKVKVSDLPSRSQVEVTKICDKCNRYIYKQPYARVMILRNENGKDYCVSCGNARARKIKWDNYATPETCLSTTHPEIAKQLKDTSLGEKLTHGSAQRVDFICKYCSSLLANRVVDNVVNQGITCPRCSSGYSFPETIMFNVLNQLNVYFEYGKVFEWSQGKIYDFYIPELSCIIETHGIQHYEENGRGQPLNIEQANDVFKEKIARENNISSYIVINCSKSNFSFIQNNIVNSGELNKLLNLSMVDWGKVDKDSAEPLTKKITDLWNSGVKDHESITQKLKISRHTTHRHLIKGAKLGWCDYDPIKAQEENGKSIGIWSKKNLAKEVVQLSVEGHYIKTWSSLLQAQEGLNKEGIRVSYNGISLVCRGKQITAGGFKWVFKKDFKEELNKETII